MVKLVTLILAFTVLTSFVQEEECKNLIDGRYKVSYKTKGYEKADFELLIDKNSYTTVQSNGRLTKGQIDWIDQCSFSLYQEPSDTLVNADDTSRTIAKDSISRIKPLIVPVVETNLSLLLGQSRTYYELEKKSKTRYHFRMTSTARPHITLAEGQIIRLGN